MNITSVPQTVPLTSSIDRSMPDHDELLQSSRRVDWRFLLPQPDLTETAFVGSPDVGLLESLRKFCSSLVELELPAADFPDHGQFSVVVASNPTQPELGLAAQSVRPGGFVYVEVDRRRRMHREIRHGGSPLRSITACLNAMCKAHLVESQVHWHWPNLESCTELIPLHDHAACVCAMSRRGSGARSQWKARFALLLLRLHVLTRLVPCFSIVGQRFQQEDSGSRPSSVLDH